YIEITNKKIPYEEKKNIIGHTLDVRFKKSKSVAYDPTETFSVNSYNEGGFNIIDEHARLFIETGIVSVGGAGWLTFGNVDGEEVKVQGVDKLTEYLKENEEDYKNLVKMLENEQKS